MQGNRESIMEIPEISVVTSLFYSEKYLDEFISRLIAALKEIQCSSYEIIVVNDGSPDNSLEKILSLKERYQNIIVLDLSRNFGHHYAFFAGMQYSTGKYVFNIDCDLEVDPHVLVEFYEELKASDYDVVFGYQDCRRGSYLERVLGSVFWRLFEFLSGMNIKKNMLTERLMKRSYVDELVKIGDKNLFMAGIMNWIGFRQKAIVVQKKKRPDASTYSLTKKFKLLVDAVTSFSAHPLKLLFGLGAAIASASLAYGSFLIVRKLLYPDFIMSGYTSLSVLILFATGVIIASLGAIGIYIEKIFNQVKNRPLFVIKDIYK